MSPALIEKSFKKCGIISKLKRMTIYGTVTLTTRTQWMTMTNAVEKNTFK
jgi:hypothetical protein